MTELERQRQRNGERVEAAMKGMHGGSGTLFRLAVARHKNRKWDALRHTMLILKTPPAENQLGTGASISFH